jgi:hypothetical protein
MEFEGDKIGHMTKIWNDGSPCDSLDGRSARIRNNVF